MRIPFFSRKHKRQESILDSAFRKLDSFNKGREMVEMGISYRTLEKYDRALELFEKADKDYNYGPAKVAYGITLHLMGDRDGAIKYFTSEIQIQKAKSNQISNLLAIELLTNLGGIYQHNREIDKAISYYDEAFKIEVSSGEHRIIHSGTHLNLAICLVEMGRVKEADFHFCRRLEFESMCPMARKVLPGLRRIWYSPILPQTAWSPGEKFTINVSDSDSLFLSSAPMSLHFVDRRISVAVCEIFGETNIDSAYSRDLTFSTCLYAAGNGVVGPSTLPFSFMWKGVSDDLKNRLVSAPLTKEVVSAILGRSSA